MNGVKELSAAEFPKEVLKSDLPVLVDFFAPWCGPCRALAPALEDLAKAYEGRVKLVKVNVDEAPDLAYEHGIRGVPTVLIFRDGKAVDGFVGLTSLNVLRSKLNAVAKSPSAVAA